MYDLAIYVEDPGAANYITPLLPDFAEQGWSVILWAGGVAQSYLRDRQVSFDPVISSHNPERHALDLLVERSPCLLLVGTAEDPDTLGLHLIEAARKLSITSVGVVDAYANADRRWRGNSDRPLTYAPDWLLVPDEPTASIYSELGYPTERLAVCGHPHYDWVRDRVKELNRLDRDVLRRDLWPSWSGDQRIVVFVAEVSTGLNPEQYRRSAEYTLSGTGQSDRRTDIVIEELLLAVESLSERPFLVLRLHPKNTVGEFSAYLDAFDAFSQGGDPLAVVYCTDLVVGMTSMLLAEAALAGRPVLSVIPRSVERDWFLFSFAEFNLIQVVDNRASLKLLIAQFLNPLELSPSVHINGPKIIRDCNQKVLKYVSSFVNSAR